MAPVDEETAERLLLLFVFVVFLTVVEGVDEREVLLTLLLLRDTAVDELPVLLRVTVEDELTPVEPALLRAVRVVEELPVNVLSLRPVVALFVAADERVERPVLFTAALFVALRVLAASPRNDVLRPVVAVVVRPVEDVLRDEATAELRPPTADEVEAYPAPVLRPLLWP